jgi:hypothetical protein
MPTRKLVTSLMSGRGGGGEVPSTSPEGRVWRGEGGGGIFEREIVLGMENKKKATVVVSTPDGLEKEAENPRR